ncbi:MAG TPA: flagellar biosynthetic protein FliR [Phycisphaerae bacterium]|nr:flagellar biosynthetic protein FliR [Phycisphaerae bacterium]
MDLWTQWILPAVLLLGRVSAFVMTLPVFGWAMLPAMVRVGVAVMLTVFFAMIGLLPVVPADTHWLAAGLVLIREILCGLALGLAINLIFHAVRQAGRIISTLMGLSEAGIIDPVTGVSAQAMEMFFEITFALMFLLAGGHHVLLVILHRSYAAFPVGALPEVGSLAEALVLSGSDMFRFALKLAAPMLAAFVVLMAALAVLAKAMPEVNVLFLSFPLRVGLCVLVASAMMPSLNAFAGEMGQWLRSFFAG